MKDKEIKAWTIENLYIEYKTRIDKAIEYIENGRLYDVNDNCINEILLDILKGSDKE